MAKGRRRFEPVDPRRVDADGWLEMSTGRYQGPDGVIFTVPPKEQNSIIGGKHDSFGAYTNDDLEEYWKAAKAAQP